MASGNAVVSGNAVASERDAQAVVLGTQQSPATPEQISVMLLQFITELARTERPDLADLAEAAEEARQELAAPAPRLARLRILAKGLASAVAGATSLAILATRIEQAVHGL
jgi:hypothetical protein